MNKEEEVDALIAFLGGISLGLSLSLGSGRTSLLCEKGFDLDSCFIPILEVSDESWDFTRACLTVLRVLSD